MSTSVGSPEAEWRLPMACRVAQDSVSVEAVRYYRLAAAQNHADAQCNFGLRLQHGDGVAQDLVEAVRYYRLAAMQNHAHLTLPDFQQPAVDMR